MTSLVSLTKLDFILASAGKGLSAVFGKPAATRPSPALAVAKTSAMNSQEASLSGALMRVNHVGEICAQSLYQSQALFAVTSELRAHFAHAAQEELDHLAWTQQRLDELGDRASLLNPLWYAGAFAVGSLAGWRGDRVSLGFVVETERQVEQHLAAHLDRLPLNDLASRAVVAQMKEDEARHAAEASAAGAHALPKSVKVLMRLAAHVMTRTAHYL